MPQLRMQVLGACQIVGKDGATIRFESDKVRALLIYLAVEADRAHTREYLAGLLWPDFTDKAARSNLRGALSSLRRAIADQQAAPPFFQISRQAIQFNQARDYQLDLDIFMADGVGEPSDIEQKIAHYHGEFMAGFSLPDSALFEEWQRLKREHLQRYYTELLQTLISRYEQQADYALARDYAYQLVAADPWQEDAYRRLMRLLALNGQRSAALEQFATCRQILRDELGVDPMPETHLLAEAIRQGEIGPPTTQSSPAITAEAAQPAPQVRHNLPAQAIPFVGRAAELAEIGERLHQPDCRLLTLVGPGGVGKTRLALAVAQTQLVHFEQGVYFVPLAAVTTVDGLLAALAQALHFAFSEGRSPQVQLFDYLREKSLLLVLDNVEQLLSATDLIVAMLQAAPAIKMVLTSRTRLQVQAEYLFQVEGLAYPQFLGKPEPLIDGADYPAMHLFCQTAQRIDSTFTLNKNNAPAIAQICAFVQGMPLGLVLAATWIELLSPAEIVAEIQHNLDFLAADLADLPDRQRSLRAVFDYSWKRLTPSEQTVFSQLSLFRGGFTRRAAQAVTGASLTTVLRLVNKSFLQKTAGDRFQIHEMLRWYGSETLAQNSALHQATCEHHAAYFLSFLAEREADLKGARQQTAMAEIEADLNNINLAWDYATGQNEVSQLLPAAEALCIFYEWRGRYEEGDTICQTTLQKLAHLTNAAGLRLRIRLLLWQSAFKQRLNHLESMAALLQQSQTHLTDSALRNQDIRFEKAFYLFQQGRFVDYINGEAARHYYTESLTLFRALNEPWYTAHLLFRLHQILHSLDDRAQDIELLITECLAIRQNLGDRRGVAETQMKMGFIAIMGGELATGEDYIREALALHRRISYPLDLARCLTLSSIAMLVVGKFREAYHLASEATEVAAELGNQALLVNGEMELGLAKLFLGQYETAQRHFEADLKLYQKRHDQAASSYLLWHLGRAFMGQGDYERAYQTLRESVQQHKQIQINARNYDVMVSLSNVAWHLGYDDEAQETITKCLSFATGRHNYFTMIRTLPVIALLHLKPNPLKAIELYALACQQPHIANAQYYQDVVGQQIAQAAKALDPEMVAVAQKHGQARDLWETGAELLEAFIAKKEHRFFSQG